MVPHVCMWDVLIQLPNHQVSSEGSVMRECASSCPIAALLTVAAQVDNVKPNFKIGCWSIASFQRCSHSVVSILLPSVRIQRAHQESRDRRVSTSSQVLRDQYTLS